MPEQGSSRSEMVFGLSKSEMSALFYRSVEVFMSNRDQTNFDAVYQVMLCLSDEQVDQVLKTLQPETRKAIAMWNRDSSQKGVSNTRLSGPPDPEPKRFSGPPEPSPRRLSSPPPPDTVPRPPQLSRSAQQGERIERYTSETPFMRPGSDRMWVDVGPLPAGSWHGWSDAGVKAPPVSVMPMEVRPVRRAMGRTARERVGRTGPYASSHGKVQEGSTSKGRVVYETRREVPHKEALEKGYINANKDAAAEDLAGITDSKMAPEPPAKGSAGSVAPAAGPKAKIEGKPEVYGADLQRSDVMEARKRAYELTSAIASERAENARLREELREAKSQMRDAARSHKKLNDKLQRQAAHDTSKLQILEEELAKAQGELKQASTQHGNSKREVEREQRNREREKALDAGTIAALRREVKKLLTRLQEETLRQNALQEQAVTLQEKLRSQSRLSESLQEDVQNLEKEYAGALKRLSVSESLNKDRAFQDRMATQQEREARAADIAELEATIRGQKAQMEELQRELHYLASTQSKNPEYVLSPAAAAGAEALEAAAAKERLVMEEKMRVMAEGHRRDIDDLEAKLAAAGARAQEAEDKCQQSEERLASEQSKWAQREQELRQKLEQHATELNIPCASVYSSWAASDGADAQAGTSYRSRATGAGAPMPGDVLLEIALNVSVQGLAPADVKALTHGVAQHVANAIRARKDTWRVLGVESDASPPVLHVALQHDVCYPAQTALEAGSEALRQLSDPGSLLCSGDHASQIAGIKVTECGIDRIGARDAPDVRESRSFGRRSSTLTAEDLAHCGNAKCSAMIQGLNRQLEDALFELSQIHKEAYHRSKQEDERVKQYMSDLGKLQEEAEARKSQLYDSSTTSDALLREHRAAAEQAQSKLKEATDRMARREQEEKLKVSELCGEIEHLKLAQLQTQRQVAEAQQAQAAATGMAQQFQQERVQLLSRISNLQVELDVSTKSRQDEWHHRRAEDTAREQAFAAAKQQIATLNERLIQLEHGGKANGAEMPMGPISSLERDRMAAVEHQLREARTLESDARMEIARFKSRLQLKEDECKLLAQRLDVAAVSAPAPPLVKLPDPASSQAAPEEGEDKAGPEAGEALAAPASEAARNHLLAENASLKHELETSKAMQLETMRKLDSAASELEHHKTAAQAEAHRLTHDLDLAKKIAQEREVAIDDLCHERDRLHMLLQEALRESQKREGTSEGASGVGAGEALDGGREADGQVEGVCRQCEVMRKDNKQLFQDNQKLFRDNKRMAADIKSVSADLKESQEVVRRLQIEHDALSRVNNDMSMSADQTVASPDQRTMSLENGRLRQEVESLRGELEDLHVVQELNRSLSEKLTRLSDEYKGERESSRSKIAEMTDALDALRHEKVSLESKVSDLEEHIIKLKETSHDFSSRNADTLASLQAQVQELTRSNEDLHAQNQDLDSQKTKLEQEVARLAEDLQVLRTVKKARGVELPAPEAPQTPEARRGGSMAQDRGQEVEEGAELAMTLDIDFRETGLEGSDERHQFEQDVVRDVSHAAGIAPDQIRILKMSPGSVMVDLEIMPDANGMALPPSAIAADLKRQASDASSKLRTGKRTSRATALDVLPPRRGAPTPSSELVQLQHEGRAAPPKTHAAPQMRLGASAPAGADGGGDVEKLADENQKLLGDNKRMFADCQRFVAELQQLHDENDQLVHDNRILIEDTQQLSAETQEFAAKMAQFAGVLNEMVPELMEAVYEVERLEQAEARRLELDAGLSEDEQRRRLEKAALYSLENRDLMDEHEVLVSEFKALQADKQVLILIEGRRLAVKKPS